MKAAGWVRSDYTITPEGIRVWVTFGGDLQNNCGSTMVEATVLCLAAYLEVNDPMPGEPEASGDEHTFIPLWED